MKRMIFIEGLPGIGKTTLVNYIGKKNIPNCHIVNEIISDVVQGDKQSDWFMNDINKLFKYDDGIIIFDRGPVSTLSYNEALYNTYGNPEYSNILKLFEKYYHLVSNGEIYYLKREDENYFISLSDKTAPYGSVKNQKILEKVTIKNCKKYCKKVNVVDYNFNKMEAIADEIINKYMCS